MKNKKAKKPAPANRPKVLTTVPDEVKKQMFLNKIKTCKSYNSRVKLAEQLNEFALDIPKDKGFAIFPVPHIFQETEEIVKDTLGVIKTKEVSKWEDLGKKYMRTDILDKEKLTLNSPYLKFALRKDVIATISKYLGHVPILHSIMVLYSRYHSPALVGTQLYHCDFEDINNIKVFVNATDVLESADGPFMAISAEESKGIRKTMHRKYSGSKVQLSPKNETGLVKKDAVTSIFGKAGTTAFVDTCGCFHCGSRIAKGKQDRIMIVFQYLSPASINVDMSKEKRQFTHLNSDSLDIYQKYVIGCDDDPVDGQK